MSRRLIIVLLVAATLVPLSACGRKGKPIPPEGSVYPRTYPEGTIDREERTGEELSPLDDPRPVPILPNPRSPGIEIPR